MYLISNIYEGGPDHFRDAGIDHFKTRDFGIGKIKVRDFGKNLWRDAGISVI